MKTKLKDVLLALAITTVISLSGIYLGYNLRESKYRNNIFTFCSQDAPPGLFSQCVLYFNSIMDLLNKQ
jgi:hypothetical protein